MLRGYAVWMMVAMLAVAVCAPAAAGESAEEPPGRVDPHEERERNEIGVFVGVTSGGEEEGGGREDPAETIGIEYRRQLSRLIGVGGLLEFVGGARRDRVGMVPVTFFLGSRAQLVVGAGWERSSRTGSGESHGIGRVGFGYHIGLVPGNGIRPEINIDFVDGEQLVVVGASIGWGF